MAIAIALGSKENIPVDVIDNAGIITTLVGSSPKFDVLDAASTVKINQPQFQERCGCYVCVISVIPLHSPLVITDYSLMQLWGLRSQGSAHSISRSLIKTIYSKDAW